MLISINLNVIDFLLTGYLTFGIITLFFQLAMIFNLTKFFFKSNIYKELRELGRFSGFSTPKDLFYDIPNFNNITNRDAKADVLKMMGKYNNPKSAELKINKFVTRKLREKKLKTNKTKSVSKGGKRRTKKIAHNKKTRKVRF